MSPSRAFGFDIAKVVPELEELHARLAGVVIECLPCEECIPRYDWAETLFDIDSPYRGCEGEFGKALFTREDFTRLAVLLAGIKARFLLSLNDHPAVPEIFSAFLIDDVRTSHSIAAVERERLLAR